MSISIGEALLQSSKSLGVAGVPEPRREASTLLSHVLDRNRTFLISNSSTQLSEAELKTFLTLVKRRSTGEPIQYIIGFQDFYGRSFRVTPDVLIPRPETELLVEAALGLLGDSDDERLICDVGTGSGCIAVTLLCERAQLNAIALDISARAIEVAQLNAATHKVDSRISFHQSDCFSALTPNHQFDLIVSNPPYVPATALEGLQREVREHEPRVALTPGDDGLTIIRRLLGESNDFLKPRGHLVIEIGFDQSEAIKQSFERQVWQLLEILPDLQGIPRIAVLRALF